jgi:high-affinity K+ transport system ATPase subunit B
VLLALRGVKYRAMSARRCFAGTPDLRFGVIVPSTGIKIIDVIITR